MNKIIDISLIGVTHLIRMLPDVFSNDFGDGWTPISRPNDTDFLLTRHFYFYLIFFLLFKLCQTLNLLRSENIIKWDKGENVHKCVDPFHRVSKQSHTSHDNINVNFEWHSLRTNVEIDILSQGTKCFYLIKLINA